MFSCKYIEQKEIEINDFLFVCLFVCLFYYVYYYFCYSSLYLSLPSHREKYSYVFVLHSMRKKTIEYYTEIKKNRKKNRLFYSFVNNKMYIYILFDCTHTFKEESYSQLFFVLMRSLILCCCCMKINF